MVDGLYINKRLALSCKLFVWFWSSFLSVNSTSMFRTKMVGFLPTRTWFPNPYRKGIISNLQRIPYGSSIHKSFYRKPHGVFRPSNSQLWASSPGVDNQEDLSIEGEKGVYSKTISSTWNIPGLKAEVNRQLLRCHKKISKASSRIETAQTTIQYLQTHPNVTQEELEACPNIVLFERELQELQQRLEKLNQLDGALQIYVAKNKSQEILPLDLAKLVIELECKDEPPSKPLRGPKKEKGPGAHEVQRRKPYKRYYTLNKTEIRVGKQAEDNDELSCNAEHRDGADWWLHASGCAGSHVVIRCHDNILEDEVVMDAAALAARQSKCTGQVIKVTLTRCRDVKKPLGAKAGLVQLSGSIKTIIVDMKKVESRLRRLDETCLVN